MWGAKFRAAFVVIAAIALLGFGKVMSSSAGQTPARDNVSLRENVNGVVTAPQEGIERKRSTLVMAEAAVPAG